MVNSDQKPNSQGHQHAASPWVRHQLAPSNLSSDVLRLLVQGGRPGPGSVPWASLGGASLSALASLLADQPAGAHLAAPSTARAFPSLSLDAQAAGPKLAPSRVQVERFLISPQPASSYVRSSATSRWAAQEQTQGFQFPESLGAPSSPRHPCCSWPEAGRVSVQSPSVLFLG